MDFVVILVAFLISYVIGSVPYGLILVKIYAHADLRTIGSKNIGATNVLRAGYPHLAFLTLLLDLFKGGLVVLLFSLLLSPLLGLWCGFVAVLAHNYPVWLGFKGGKGVATSLGLLLFVSPILGIFVCLTWLGVALITRISSLSALVALGLAPFYVLLLKESSFFFPIFLLSVLCFWRHRANIQRLIRGTESKISFKKP